MRTGVRRAEIRATAGGLPAPEVVRWGPDGHPAAPRPGRSPRHRTGFLRRSRADRATSGRGRAAPRCSRSKAPSSFEAIGPTLTLRIFICPRGCESSTGICRPVRAEARMPTRSSFKRRTANPSTRADDGSIQWMSSMARTSGDITRERSERRRAPPPTPRADPAEVHRRRSVRARPRGPAAEEQACRRPPSRTRPRRDPLSAEYENVVSDSTGRVESTTMPSPPRVPTASTTAPSSRSPPRPGRAVHTGRRHGRDEASDLRELLVPAEETDPHSGTHPHLRSGCPMVRVSARCALALSLAWGATRRRLRRPGVVEKLQ